MKRNNLIILTGGGSGGPVTPLLALADDLRAGGFDIAWIGTRAGIEKQIVSEAAIPYHSIAAGKFRRYFSWHNIIDPFKILVGFFQSISLLTTLGPRLVITAGAFVSVPVVWAAWALRIKVIVHQEDIRPGLANRLMAPCADVVTVTFEESLKDYGNKARWTGNPVRQEFRNAAQHEPQPYDVPRVLILGGGTGATGINNLVAESLEELIKFCSITHICGQREGALIVSKERYTLRAFLNAADMAQEMKAADLVITRAGLATLTELSYLAKPAIIIPMPNSHQEDNAAYFEKKGAALVLQQSLLSSSMFIDSIKNMLTNAGARQLLSSGIKAIMKSDAQDAMMKIINEFIG